MRRNAGKLAAVFAAMAHLITPASAQTQDKEVQEIRHAGLAQAIRRASARGTRGHTRPAKPKNQRQRRKRERQNPHLRAK